MSQALGSGVIASMQLAWLQDDRCNAKKDAHEACLEGSEWRMRRIIDGSER